MGAWYGDCHQAALGAEEAPPKSTVSAQSVRSAAGGFMDVAEFRRLSVRVVTTRNLEMRAFRQAFDLTPGITPGWSERTCANWRVWSGANDALRGSVGELEAFLSADGPQAG
jgi:hypothetical protein